MVRSNFRGSSISNQPLAMNFKMKPYKNDGKHTHMVIYKSQNKHMYPKARNYMSLGMAKWKKRKGAKVFT